jgi:hypothetical protein
VRLGVGVGVAAVAVVGLAVVADRSRVSWEAAHRCARRHALTALLALLSGVHSRALCRIHLRRHQFSLQVRPAARGGGGGGGGGIALRDCECVFVCTSVRRGSF